LSAAVASAKPGTESQEDIDLSSSLINELRDADVLVIGVPMYNFSIPSSLKCWIDHVAIAGKTFRYTAEGRPEGLLQSKRAFVIASRGGVYESGPMVALNYHDTYLRVFLSFLGIQDVTVITAERQNLGPAEKSEGLRLAYEQVERAIANSSISAEQQ
jgi:FMN-dependent NADH-azoreductase